MYNVQQQIKYVTVASLIQTKQIKRFLFLFLNFTVLRSTQTI